MTISSRHLLQDATFWSRTGSDGYGGYTFSSPVALKVRWEDKRELFTSLGGEEQVSQAIVYSEQDMAVGDYLFLGTSTADDPTLLSGSYQVKAFGKTTNLRNIELIRKATL